MRVRFGGFAFDRERRELCENDRPIHLTPKAFELLRILIDARPKAISQSDLYDALWPDTFVQTTNLHNLVRELRTALGDRSHKIIRTNYGFGFSFGADAFTDDAAPPIAQMLVADQTFVLHEGENVIGRTPAATVQIDSSSVSRVHARITISAGAATIEDLRSKNGTFLHGKRLRSPAPIADGDEVTFGSVAAVFRVAQLRDTDTLR